MAYTPLILDDQSATGLPDLDAMANAATPATGNNLGLRASRNNDAAPATALADFPTDHSYLDIPAFLRRQAD